MERLRKAMDSTVRQLLPELPYLAVVQARVLQDHGDHTVDLEPLDRTLPLMTRVPYEIPFAGARTKVKEGAILLVGFEGGDMTRRHALAFRSGALEYLRIECGACVIECDSQNGRVVIRGTTVEINS